MALFRKNGRRRARLSMRARFILALVSIASILLLSSVISVLEYGRMSNYVSNLVAENIRSIELARRLETFTDAYHLRILDEIGEENYEAIPHGEADRALEFHHDSLRFTFENAPYRTPSMRKELALADSLYQSYMNYMTVSEELAQVIESDFTDSRTWYFGRLNPCFNDFKSRNEALINHIYSELRSNSGDFQASFYRSIVPGVVSVGVGILLVLLLMFFILTGYVNPLYRMLSNLDTYRQSGRRYSCTFEGEDELSRLNTGITDVVEENINLKRRLNKLKEQ
ncbi:MAG: hypothetical protein HUJ94_00390 [Bacteroidales bacterium]|nr:hypothetical protein [Bacteroidales bacterium]